MLIFDESQRRKHKELITKSRSQPSWKCNQDAANSSPLLTSAGLHFRVGDSKRSFTIYKGHLAHIGNTNSNTKWQMASSTVRQAQAIGNTNLTADGENGNNMLTLSNFVKQSVVAGPCYLFSVKNKNKENN